MSRVFSVPLIRRTAAFFRSPKAGVLDWVPGAAPWGDGLFFFFLARSPFFPNLPSGFSFAAA